MVWGHESPTQQGGIARGLAMPLCFMVPRPTPDISPSPIKTSQWEKPKYLIRILERYRDLLPSLTQDWEGPEALLGTLLKRGITTGGLPHYHVMVPS
jgi:hypothetical protein